MRLTLPEPLGSAHVLPLLQLEIEFAAFGSSRAIHVSGDRSGHVVALAKQKDQMVDSLQLVPVTLLANNLDEHARVMTKHCVVQSPARTGIGKNIFPPFIFRWLFVRLREWYSSFPVGVNASDLRFLW